MQKGNRFEIRIAGFGGQGIVTIGRILGTAFTVFEGINSVNTQSYGPESRGGACKSEVVVTDGDINYPYVRQADVLIAMSQVALDTYIGGLKAGGILVIDSDSVTAVPASDGFRLFEVPFLALAHAAAGVKYQNAVALGALYALIPAMLKETSLRQAIEASVPPHTVAKNLTAFEEGWRYLRELIAPEGDRPSRGAP